MKHIFLSLTLLASTWQLFAKQNVQGRPANLNKTAAGCNQTTAVIDLDINNVRAHLMNGGDMWWDRPTGSAYYEVPKNSNKHSLFAGSIWVGGYDHTTGTLKVAAQTYRQTGNDYWSGPLDENNGYSIAFQTCADWDRFWKINASDITAFKSIYNESDPLSVRQNTIQQSGSVPDVIKEWPAKGNQTIKSAGGNLIAAPQRDMAEFVDIDNDGIYNWEYGDYPKISGDQYIWWIFNDKGDAKTETTSDAIGLEIHTAAFAFATNDCLNEATFYNYKVHNFSTSQLDSTFFATWCDADLGYAFDDYVGCDTSRGLGILYNGDSYDEGAQGYGFDLPLVGIDYFQGPKYRIPGTLIDTELKMTVFTYFNNISGPTGNPDVLDDYYQFITGSWKDGQPFTTACNARDAGPATKFIFYGDPIKGGWSEASCNNQPNDRRFIHSSGPFPLVPGAEPNNITIGAIWVPNAGGGSSANFSKIQICDDKAQDLFDNSFKLPFGPQAPQVTTTALDKQIIFDLYNLKSSNNYNEGYGTNLSNPYMRETSKKAIKNGSSDTLYKFEGYVVYQLKNEGVSLSDLRNKDGSVNTEVAQIVFQCDKKNGIKDILNFEIDPSTTSDFYTPKLMVSGQDSGLKHTFRITKDAFATGTSKSLVNYKTYYYMVLAYGYNNFKTFNPAYPDSTQDKAYIESRTDGREEPIKVISVMPTPANDSLYIQTYADYGTGIDLKRIEGKGNGGYDLELTEKSINEILQNNAMAEITYKGGNTPLDLKVVNPDSLKAGNYEIWLLPTASHPATLADSSKGAVADMTKWMVVRNGVDTIFSSNTIQDYNEQYLRKYGVNDNVLFDWGLSLNAKQQDRPGDNPTSLDNGVIRIENSVQFEDVNDAWLSGVRDQDGKSFNNWIRAGIEYSALTDPQYNNCSMIDWNNSSASPPVINNPDQLGTFEKLISGTFAPYNLVNNINLDECGFGVMYGTGSDRNFNRLQEVYSIDLVFTSDRSKWTKCAVIEMTDYNGVAQVNSENGAYKHNLRKAKGLLKDPDQNGNPQYSSDPNDDGTSWFPGYAINIETGERLNISFGEESANILDNGRDMIWNPSSVQFDPVDFHLRWGGKHLIYVHRTRYDEGNAFKSVISKNAVGSNDQQIRTAYQSVMWVGVPLLARGSTYASFKDGIIPTNTRLKLRVTRPYATHTEASQTVRNSGWPLYSFNTEGLAPAFLGDAANNYTNDKQAILDRIHAVPNPYYAISEYEQNRLDNRVRIINLPEKATIKIYTIDGALIRTINKNDSKTNFVDWDIKNDKGIPIASGMYLMHVNLPGIGETVVKWFGAMRPIDLISF
ncbi:MAG: hypothetical protein R2831_00755 [Chitinophagaceae bacterium]